MVLGYRRRLLKRFQKGAFGFSPKAPDKTYIVNANAIDF